MDKPAFKEYVNSSGDKEGQFYFGWSSASADFLRKNQYRRIVLDGSFKNLEFLEEFGELVQEVILDNDQGTVKGIECLRNLTFLNVKARLKEPIEFRLLGNLEVCMVPWHRDYAESLFSLPKIRRVILGRYSLPDFTTLPRSQSLIRMSLRRPSLVSFDGIERLESLEHLDASDCDKLRSISALSKTSRLQILSLENAKKLENVEGLESAKGLESLRLVNVSGFSEATFLSHLNKLSHLVLAGRPVRLDWDELLARRALRSANILCAEDAVIDEAKLGRLAKKHGKKVTKFEVHGTERMPGLVTEFICAR